MKNPKFTRAFEVVTELPKPLEALKTLAGNFYWSWNHDIRGLFRSIDKDLWEECEHNTVLFLNKVPAVRWDQLVADSGFMSRLEQCEEILDRYLNDKTWFDKTYDSQKERMTVGYFCFEFGITEGLPIYSGGLGILAGDHLKSASDLGLPLVAVGLLYNRGYFRQRLSPDGWQQEVYPQYDFYQMPLTLMRDAENAPIRIEVAFPDRIVTCQIWRADVGRIPLYLLDSNVLENAPDDQGITDSLYSGDEEMRIRQEMILGIGGMKALQALGIKPTVCHMNEGHAAFMAIERIRQFIQQNGVDFKTAQNVTAHGNVFTTHTPVPAGFDLFPPQLLEKYMGKHVAESGIDFASFVKLGRFDPNNNAEAFNMALLAMESANNVNGVARLHGEVSRRMFSSKWNDYPENEVPIDHVTNGIHTMTWIGKRMAELYDAHCGTAWRRNPSDPANWAGVDDISDEDLWSEIENQRGELVRFVRKSLARNLARRNMSSQPDHDFASKILDPRVLTIGFARRFATYKRGSLMITDPERLKSILYHPERPVQILISGKSHPRDDAGKKLIQELYNFTNNGGARTRMVFLEDYDMQVARRLVQGVDVWLNNPRRPYEASGTSGMKVVPNGGLNCSILDGWWDEGFQPGLGFVIGDRSEGGDTGHQDWLDSRSLYDVIENQIAPVFYHRVEKGIPVGWLQMVRQSLKHLAPEFSTHRMVQDYTRKFYVPASEAFEKMEAGGAQKAKDALVWKDRVRGGWSKIRIGGVWDSAGTGKLLGGEITVNAEVEMGDLQPNEVKVQAVSGKVSANREITHTEAFDLTLEKQEGSKATFTGKIPCNQVGYQGYTIRVIPHHEDVAIPAELNLACWQ
jgi:glycogen phosphorylase